MGRHWMLLFALLPAVLPAGAAEEPADGTVETTAEAAESDVQRVQPTGTGAPARVDGPSVEIITGGSSTDGAARVGRMPVID